MEKVINLHVEKLPEGQYLATSPDVQGLVAQGRTVSEAIGIAQDVARKLIETRIERQESVPFPEVSDTFDSLLVIGC